MYKCFQSVCVVVGRWDAKVCEIEGGIFAKELIEISDWEVRREREIGRGNTFSNRTTAFSRLAA